MKNIKLKQTGICLAIMNLPAVILLFSILLLVGLDIFVENERLSDISFAVLVIFLVLNVAYYIKFGSALFYIFNAINEVEKWKADRKFYFTDINGKTVESAESSIKKRIEKFGKRLELEGESKVIEARKKRKFSTDDDFSGCEEYITLYKFDFLTKSNCSAAVSESKKIVEKYSEDALLKFLLVGKEKKAPILRKCAVIIICNSAELEAVEYVRKSFSKNNIGLVLCVCEMNTGRYYINGSLLQDTPFSMSDPEVLSVKLIKKYVFGNKMNLKNNEYFLSAKELPFDPDTSFFEVITKSREEVDNAKNEMKRESEKLANGQVLLKNDIIYYKKDNKAVAFGVLTYDKDDEFTAEDTITILAEKNWTYPKSSKISNEDYEEIINAMTVYLNNQKIKFMFKDFEKWLEEC